MREGVIYPISHKSIAQTAAPRQSLIRRLRPQPLTFACARETWGLYSGGIGGRLPGGTLRRVWQNAAKYYIIIFVR